MDNDDSQDESDVPDVLVIWIIASTMGPASGIVTNGEALGYKLDLSIVAVMKLSLILRAAVFSEPVDYDWNILWTIRKIPTSGVFKVDQVSSIGLKFNRKFEVSSWLLI